MVGDSDQLPSVGAGNILKDIVIYKSNRKEECSCQSIYQLTENGKTMYYFMSNWVEYNSTVMKVKFR